MQNEETVLFPAQRQSPVGVWVEIMYSLVNMAKRFWPLLIYILVQFNESGIGFKLSGVGFLIIAGLIVGYLNYRNYWYSIDEVREEFIVQQGIFTKKRSVIQLSKIQQVSINQSFIQRLVDVYGIELETAGSTKNEISIKAVSKQEALRIKSRIEKGSKQAISIDKSESPAKENNFFFNITLASLIKTGITSRYLESAGILLAFSYTVLSQLQDLGFVQKDAEEHIFDGVNPAIALRLGLSILLAVVILTLVFNLIRIILVYYNFQITRSKKSLLLSYGLFHQKNTMINPNKVQISRVSSNYFQRKLDVYQFSIQQATSDSSRDKKATIHIPGCSIQESNQLLNYIYGADPKKGDELLPNKRKMLAAILKYLLVPVLIIGIFAAFFPVLHVYLFLLIPYFACVLAAIYYSFKNYRLFIHPDFIIKQSGLWDVKTEIIEPYKIQAISTQQNLWHEKIGIGHVTLHTAGGDIHFKCSDYIKIKQYVNHWLYQIETSKKDWM